MELIQGASSQVLIVSTVSLATIYAIIKFTNKYFYWQRRGIRGPRPSPFGDLSFVFEKDPRKTDLAKRDKYGKVYGSYLFGNPRLFVADADVMKQVLIKDFDAFPGRQVFTFANKFQKLFLIFLTGDQWKKVRALMSPSFTSGKMKRMFRFMDGCADDLLEYLNELCAAQRQKNGTDKEPKEYTVKIDEAFAMYSMDGIATCGYGLKLRRDQLDKQESELEAATAAPKDGPIPMSRNKFVEIAGMVLTPRIVRIILVSIFPSFLLRILGFSYGSEQNFLPMCNCVKQIIKRRMQDGATGERKYDDLLQLLLDARLDDKLELNELDQAENHHAALTKDLLLDDQRRMVAAASASDADSGVDSSEESSKGASKSMSKQMSEIEVLSNAVLLLSAGLETTSILLTNCAYALAHHPEIQERLHDELERIVEYDASKSKHIFKYETLTTCSYLDSVLSETLRILPPVTRTERKAARDYRIEKYDILIPKGSSIQLGFRAVQNDPDYWEEPDKFNPDRFMPENRDKIVPGSYLPFSLGPRHCVGMRFSLTEAKLGLARTVMKFKFTPVKGTTFLPRETARPGLVRIKDPRVNLVPRM